MSEQSTTTKANNSCAEPVLCKMGCGFFGNSATGNCCSKCFCELQKKQGGNDTNTTTTSQPQSNPQPQPSTGVCPTPMETDDTEPVTMEAEPMEIAASPEPAVEASVTAMNTAKPEEKKRKKKKKTSYKSMMANMTKRTKDEADIEKEKQNLRKVTGGGAFSKIDRI